MAVQTKRANASQERIPRGRTPTDAHVPRGRFALFSSYLHRLSHSHTSCPRSSFNETTCRCCYVESARRHRAGRAEGEAEAEVGSWYRITVRVQAPRVCSILDTI